MLRLYFLTALRSLLRNKSYSLLNITGLALGISCSLLLFLVIRYELSYDAFHSKAGRIYRVTTETDFGETTDHNMGSRFPLASILRSNGNLGVERLTQLYAEMTGQINVLEQDGTVSRRFLEEKPIGFVEPEFFDLFDFETGGVDPRPALAGPGNVVLTQSLAAKYFPGENATGRIIRLNNKLNLTVAAVIPDFPPNTDFPFVMLIPYESYKRYTSMKLDGFEILSSNQQLYLLLPEGVSPEAKAREMNAFFNRHRPKNLQSKETYSLQPLRDIHFNPEYGNFALRTLSREVIWSMALIAVFLVLIACINFVNLATAQAVKRAKEVGVRKVLGSSKHHLVLQFLGETLLITMLAALCSIIMVELALPYLNSLLEIRMSFRILQDPAVLLFLVAEVLLVTLFAGLYPAVILARFQPIEALRSRINTQRVAGLPVRQGLVVLQFTICQVLIICTLVVNEQMEFFMSKSLGFTKEAVVTVVLPNHAGEKMIPLREEMLRHPAIQKVSFAAAPPSANMVWGSNFSFNNSSQDAPFQANVKVSDPYYFDLFEIKLAAGRTYSTTDSAAIVINETMRRKLGLASADEALGKTISMGRNGFKAPIIGVVEDYHQNPLHHPIDPAIMFTNPEGYVYLSAKIVMQNRQEALQHLEKVWYTAYPDDVFNYEFLDETIANFYRDEARQNKLFRVFSIIAIFIGCLGLYGLVAFMVAQRTKELGVRKVMGATVLDITVLFSREFVKLVLIAFVLAAPIAWYLMHSWLQEFTYRISMGYWPFMLAGVATLLIAMITMSSQTVRAAMADPVLSLKTE